MTIKTRLAELRKRANLTQDELGRLAGYTQDQISKWETGKRSPTSDQVRELARRLRIHPGELFDPIPRDYRTPTEERIAAIIDRLSGEDLESWIDTGERLARLSAGNGEQRPRAGNRRSNIETPSRDWRGRS